MAYLCPVCAEPQVDAAHLANHLAFTALIRGGDHETWLDEQAPAWDDHDESWLAGRVRESVAETDHPVDKIETGSHGQTGHGGGENSSDRRPDSGGTPGVSLGGDDWTGELDADARAVVEAARELTRRMAGDTADGDAPGEDETESVEGETE